MRAVSIAALGVAAYAVFLAATFPAHYAARQLQARTGGAFEAREVSGTIWKGEAASATVTTAAGTVGLERLRWRWRPGRLLGGRLAFDVEAASGAAQARGEVARTLTGWELHEAELRAPASFAARVAPWLTAWQPDGTLRASAARLRWHDGSLEGEALAEWRDAALALSTVKPLGHYRAQLRGGNPSQVELATLSGPLRLAGRGTWSPQAGLDFTGEARGDGPAAAALEPLLGLLGPRRPDGSRSLAWRTR